MDVCMQCILSANGKRNVDLIFFLQKQKRGHTLVDLGIVESCETLSFMEHIHMLSRVSSE